MATTLKANMFVPEVATEVATAQFPTELAMRMAGSPFVRPFPASGTLREGDTVTFPRFDPMSAFAAMTEDVALTPQTLTTSTDTATVQHAGLAAEITDVADLASRGDPSTEVGMQMARRAAEYVDDALLTEAYTTALSSTPGATFAYSALVDALMTNWGDRAFMEVGGIIVHSKVAGDIMTAAEFAATDKAPDNMSTAHNGMIGSIARIPLYVSDRINVDTVPTPDEYDCLVVKRGGLGLQFQRELFIESDRDILKKNTVISADIFFAVHLYYGVPSPAITIAWQ